MFLGLSFCSSPGHFFPNAKSGKTELPTMHFASLTDDEMLVRFCNFSSYNRCQQINGKLTFEYYEHVDSVATFA